MVHFVFFWFLFGHDRRNTEALTLSFKAVFNSAFKADGLSVDIGFSFYFVCFPDQYSDVIHSQLQISA